MYLFYFYNVLLHLFSLPIILYFLFNSIFSDKYKNTLADRFGFLKVKANSSLWFHAVSVGEVIGAIPLIKKIQQIYPNQEIVLSTTTKSGRATAEKALDNVKMIYFPLDFPNIIRKTYNLLNPKALFIMETEIWPNLINIAVSKNLPVFLINGRISDRALNRSFILKPIFCWLYDKVSLFCMQTQVDADRIIRLGAKKEKVIVTGNMKIDELYSNMRNETEYVPFFRKSNNEILFIAGSTHKGEEEIIIQVYKRLLEKFPNIYLLIAPRHLERIKEISKIIKRQGFNFALKSEIKNNLENFKSNYIFILDTVGELRKIYNEGDLIFVGGSLVKRGGHNFFEPVACGKAVFFGSSYENFRGIVKILKDEGVGIEVNSGYDFFKKADKYLRNEKERKILEKKAKNLLLNNLGSTEKVFNIIRKRNPEIFM